ncbi:MAG TPA: SH3 domain-containing protein [Clostridia bacterium]|nr:SH3 domain-containing protein [Clostridia bacterium]
MQNLPSYLIATGDYVNIRKGPGTQYSIITQVNKNTLLNVIDRSSNWYKVRLQNGTVGWIAGWLTATPLPSSIKVTANDVNIRKGPGTNYGIITQVKKGTVLSALDKSGDWYKVKLQNGTIGWIAGWLVVPSDTSNNQSNSNSATQSSNITPNNQTPKNDTPPANTQPGSTVTNNQTSNTDISPSSSNNTSANQDNKTPAKLYTVDSVKFDKQGESKGVIISTDSPNYTVTKQAAKSVIFVELNNTVLRGEVRGFGVDDEIVRGVLPNQISPTLVRIVITLNKDANYSVTREEGKLIININPSVTLSTSLMIAGDVVNIRSGPGTQYDVVAQLTRGYILEMLDKSGDWYKVKLKDGRIGWVAGWLVTVYQIGDGSTNIADRRTGNVPSRGDLGQALSSLPYAGKGVWYSIYSTMPTALDLSRFASSNVTHIYLEVATSTAGFKDEWKAWLDDVVPAAHRAGIKVIAWLYTDLKNPAYDADLTLQVANYTTPSGHRVDAVAADIEDLPQTDPIKASQMVEDYATQVLKDLPAAMPFIAITYPPQYRPNYPYSTMAKYFNAIALMDYWHVSSKDYTYDDSKNFVSESIRRLREWVGNDYHIEVILHGYDEKGFGLPTLEELRGALDAAKEATGYSIYTWNTLTDELKDLFASY